jgi:hypothetical protein
MKLFFYTMLMMMTGTLIAQQSDSSKNLPPSKPTQSAIYLKYEDYKWEKLIPELGDLSAEMTILHVDPTTGSTQLMIRCPKNYHAPKHWHTANETHYCVYGHFLMRDEDGKVADLSPGGYNYMPSKMIHEGWSNSEEGNLLYISVDGPWDINFINGAPTPQQVHDMTNRPVFPKPSKPPVYPQSH